MANCVTFLHLTLKLQCVYVCKRQRDAYSFST